MFSGIFIDRPRLAFVIAIVIRTSRVMRFGRERTAGCQVQK